MAGRKLRSDPCLLKATPHAYIAADDFMHGVEATCDVHAPLDGACSRTPRARVLCLRNRS